MSQAHKISWCLSAIQVFSANVELVAILTYFKFILGFCQIRPYG